MGRDFIFAQTLGALSCDINESMFLLCAASQRTQRSARPKILIFLDGKCRITLKDGFDEIVETDDIFILPTPCFHTYSSVDDDKDVRVYTFGLFFPEDTLKKRTSPHERDLQNLLKRILTRPCLLRGGLDLEIRHLISEFRTEHEENRTGKSIRQRAICLSLLVALARRLEQPLSKMASSPRTAAHLINEVKEYMLKAKHTPLTLGKIAWHVRISEEYLARIFKKETGMTVMDYLRFLRIDAAKIYLLNSNDTVETLARRLGFGSVNPFCRTFKKATGLTPTEYRVNHAGVRA